MNGARGRRPLQPRWSRRERMLLIYTAAASVLVLAGSGVVSMFVSHLNQNIATESMNVVGPLPPPSKSGVLNVLALGSQTRDGQGRGFGHDPGTDLSDTAMLIHLNAAHTRAIVVSIPRDLLVYRPSCRERVGGTAIVPANPQAMFDSAMNFGGPACAVATVEHMSGIRIDHFIRIDFNGFRTMTNVLGGVQICVPPPGIHDWRSHLSIAAGLHVVSGNEALAFVRDRHGIGNGGDLGRIQMQQMFVSSLIKKVMSSGTLTNPLTLYNIADAATRSLTTDPSLGSVQALLSMAQTLRSLSLRNITFVTLPNQLDPHDINRLVPTRPQASEVWHMLRADLPWAKPAPARPRTMRPRTARPRTARRLLHQGRAQRPSHLAIAAPAAPAPAAPAAPVQTRNAGDDICSGLPRPNNLGAS